VSGELELEAGGRTIRVTNADRVVLDDAGAGITKGEVARYYQRVAPSMLPHVVGRPLVVQRFPQGTAGPGFYQKNTPAHAPDWLDTVELATAEGGATRYPVVADAGALVWLANQGSIVFHTLLSAAADPDRPVEVIFDLDPSTDDLGPVRAAARHLRDILEDLGLSPRVKSSGSRGLHVVVDVAGPADFDESRRFAVAVAEVVVAREPERFTLEFHKTDRRDRLFLDVLRNGRAAHAVAPYSLRARPGAPVAVPLTWDEALSAGFAPRRITIANVFRRLARVQDPWAERPGPSVPLGEALERLVGR
jgi:bifunctional non-homologous end joining protein LigD